MFKLGLLHKVLLVLGVGIVVPAVLLAYLVFRQTLAQPEIERARLEAYSRDVVDTKAALIQSGLENYLQRFAGAVEGENVDEIVASLQDLESAEIVSRSFLIEDGSGILYPDVSLAKPEKPEDVTVALPELSVNRVTRRATLLEAGGKDLRFAASLYSRALSSASSNAVKAELRHRLAVISSKREDFEDAAEYARTAADLFESTQGRSWKWVLATYNAGRWAAEAGIRRRAAFPLVLLYADIVRAKEPFGIGERTELFKERILSVLHDLGSTRPSPDPAMKILEYLETLREEEADLAEQRLFVADLNLLVPPRLSLAGSQPAGGEVDVVHGLVHGEPVEFAFWTMPETEGHSLLAGFSVDLPVAAQLVGKRYIPNGGAGGELLISLVDAEGHLLAGQSPPDDVRPLASVRMTELIPGWELQARERNPGQIEKLARRYLVLYSALLALVAVAISLSVWFTARSLAREVELGRLKSEFVSSVSHELKTPLSLIQLHNDTLSMNRLTDSGKKAKYHEVIGRECGRLTRLIDRVLDFSRIEISRRKYDFQEEDLASVLESAIETCTPEAAVKDIVIDAHGLSKRVAVRADAEALRQALENIIDNAIKYSPRKSRIEVSLRAEDNRAAVSVTDSGIGIEPKEQRKIFEEFYRGARPEVKAVRGSGLGLALAQHAVRGHGGALDVSSAVGKGTTFTLTMPLATEA
jgi:signal transduction histidine kinase